VDHPPTAGPAALECGQVFRSPPRGELLLTGRFPKAVGPGERSVSGTVEVVSAKGVARGVVTRQADAFLVRDGRVMTLPVVQDLAGRQLDLAPGRVEKLPARAALVPCDPAATVGGSLRPGAYALYVRVLLNHDDGSSRESIGGPWPLQVR
jgi:hypothetical protein